MIIKREETSIVDEEVFQLIWENTNDAIFLIGQDGEILHANPTFTDILGWTIDDIRGVTPPPFFVDMTPEQHEVFKNTLKNGQNINYCITKRKSKDGEILDILATYRAINKGEILAVGMYKDFTEQIEIQRKLEASEDCYRNLVEFLPDAVIVHNKHHIVFANPAGVNFLGQENLSSLVGRSIWKYIYSDNKERIKQSLVEVSEKNKLFKPTPNVEKILRFDYKVFYVEITSIPIEFNGESVMQILFRDVSDKKKYEMQLEKLAYHDPLTGLKNRRSFNDILEKTIESTRFTGEQHALMYLDLDKFKEVNDTLGHEMGDELLKHFAARLANNLRENSVICRIGGDEFLILIQSVSKLESVTRIVQRLYKVLQQPYHITEHIIEITASIGVSIFPQDGNNGKTLIKQADKALYEAKKVRNEINFYKKSYLTNHAE